jgi:hypothetical protein
VIVKVAPLSSFTRTIPAYKSQQEIDQVISRRDYFIPLTFQPARAHAGDFIYLIYKGWLIGRARISAIESVAVSSGEDRYPDWARWIVRYTGGWEKPPRQIPVQGHQSVRYLETHSLGYLDAETW